jgi:hypothetical protein
MTPSNPEALIGICDTIAGGILTYSKAARANGVSPRTFWHWIKASQSGDEGLLVEYLGETIPFHKAVNAARRIAMHEMRGRMEERSILGHFEPVLFHGMPTWKPDPAVVGIDDPDVRELITGYRDGLLRDESGCVIQNAIWHPAPVALQLRVAEMAFPTEYRPGTNNTLAVSGGIAVGVQIVPAPKAPPAIPPAPLPPLEVVTDEDQLQIPEVDEEQEFDVPAADDEASVKQPEPEPVVICEPAPAQYQPPAQTGVLATKAERSGRPLTPLERDLLSRARGSVEDRMKPVGS